MMGENTCPVCDAEFDTHWSLEQHMEATGHSNEIINYPEGDEICHGCSEVFTSVSALHQHMVHCSEIEDL